MIPDPPPIDSGVDMVVFKTNSMLRDASRFPHFFFRQNFLMYSRFPQFNGVLLSHSGACKNNFNYILHFI